VLLCLTGRPLSLSLIKLLFNPVSLKDSFCEVCHTLQLFLLISTMEIMKLGQENSVKIAIKRVLLIVEGKEKR
jgi:hypothetical protein